VIVNLAVFVHLVVAQPALAPDSPGLLVGCDNTLVSFRQAALEPDAVLLDGLVSLGLHKTEADPGRTTPTEGPIFRAVELRQGQATLRAWESQVLVDTNELSAVAGNHLGVRARKELLPMGVLVAVNGDRTTACFARDNLALRCERLILRWALASVGEASALLMPSVAWPTSAMTWLGGGGCGKENRFASIQAPKAVLAVSLSHFNRQLMVSDVSGPARCSIGATTVPCRREEQIVVIDQPDDRQIICSWAPGATTLCDELLGKAR